MSSSLSSPLQPCVSLQASSVLGTGIRRLFSFPTSPSLFHVVRSSLYIYMQGCSHIGETERILCSPSVDLRAPEEIGFVLLAVPVVWASRVLLLTSSSCPRRTRSLRLVAETALATCPSVLIVVFVSFLHLTISPREHSCCSRWGTLSFDFVALSRFT